MGRHAMPISMLGAALLALCVGFPQIPSYSVDEVNAEVLEEVDNVETAKDGSRFVEVQEKIEEDGLSPTDVAGNIAFEVLDEVGDHLGSRGSAIKRLERLLKATRGKL